MTAKRKAVRAARPAKRRSSGPSARPPGFGTVTPYLTVRGAEKALEFYRTAFGAKELLRNTTPDGKILHARMRIGNSIVMLSELFPGGSTASPEGLPGVPVTLHLYLPNIDVVWQRAIAAGARSVMPLDDMFWGERYGQLRDPFGHQWSLSMRIAMTKREREERQAAAMRQMAEGHPGPEA